MEENSKNNKGDVSKSSVISKKVRRSNISGALISAVLVAVMLISGYIYLRSMGESAEKVSISDIIEEIKDDNVEDVTIREDRVFIETDDESEIGEGKKFFAYIPEGADFIESLQQEGLKLSDIDANVTVEPVTKVNWVDVVSIALMALLAVGVFLFVRSMQNSGGKLLDFGQSKARLIWGRKSDVGFKDVAGIKESKEELIEVVQFLKNPRKFTKLGARIPKGVLLVGPPGSGKTLLARAVAGEAGVPFFHTSGSEFEEMLVGAGASRVRDLFKKARRAAPCIIFIDEIDAVAKKRGTTLHSGNTEQTLNQILVEMDGLEPRTNVIVVAATNRPDVLDPAILRPGRFDRNIVLTLPDVHEREQILEIHSKNKKLAEDVDLAKIARRTVGFSGADLENALNEAAILAAKEDKKQIESKDIEESALKVRYGPERKSKKRESEDIKMTAYHEAGHALVAKYMKHADPVDGVSIISRGISGGMTMLLPKKDRENRTRNQMEAFIAVTVGGRVAEKIKFKDITTGASQDIKVATEEARDMVTKYGMSDKIGFVQYEDLDEMKYLGYGYTKKEYSEETARDIDLEVKRIIDEEQEKVENILTEHKDELDGLAELLLEKEVIDAEEFEAFFKGSSSSGNSSDPDVKK
ncbi:ATP-dependent zinc metalloprotease FtsH [Candidatus Dojkabacteria bacterium]|nr:ATP-dependent zinc metalloprotease FtsH [Candidatus Dojkabacteria bacterium]